jgi:hypothetical protein
MEASLIDQLEDVLTSKDVSRRADVLRKVTDLFVVGSGRFSEDQIELFDHVMGKLIENIERAACAQCGSRIATIPDAPPRRDQYCSTLNGSTRTRWSRMRKPRDRIICWRSPAGKR